VATRQAQRGHRGLSSACVAGPLGTAVARVVAWGSVWQGHVVACSVFALWLRVYRPGAMDSDGWQIEFKKGPILNSAEMEAFEKEFDMPALPEMFFGSSFAKFTHKASGRAIEFNSRDALHEWRKTCMERRVPQVNTPR
jgi:hypothetical protein